MPHLLLVDDNADHLFLTRRALRGAGIDTTGVQSGEAALDALRSNGYDMILLDHNLPGMKGAELIARIRAGGIDTPIIMVTGGGSEQTAVDSLKAGAMDYVIKNEGYLSTLAPRVQRAIAQHELEATHRKLEMERQAAAAQANENARRLRALHQASLTINRAIQSREVRNQAVAQAASLVDAEAAAFFLLTEDGLTLRIAASLGLSDEFLSQVSVPVGKGAIGSAVLRGEPVVIPDILNDQNLVPNTEITIQAGIRSVVAVPLLMRGDAQGGLTVYESQVREWEPEEISLLQNLAHNVAVAYENAQLYDSLESRVTEAETLSRIVTTLAASSELGDALNSVVAQLRELFGAMEGVITLEDPVTQDLRTMGVGEMSELFLEGIDSLHRLRTTNEPGDSPAPDLRSIQERTLQFVPDLFADERFVEFREMASRLGVNSICSVPLIPQDKPIGALSLFFERSPDLDRSARQLLETVANAVGVAVQRARLQDSLLREEAVRMALTESNRLKTDFISTVSHELRTPLASIVGYVRLIVQGHCGPLTPVQQEFLQTVERNSHRLSHLVDDLLDISRIESGTLPLQRENLNLAAVISECATMMEPEAETRKMQIHLQLPEELPSISGDPERLGEVMTNFLSNAVKYGKDGTPIEVKVWLAAGEDSAEIIVSVQDYGIGIAAEEIPKLFRKFYRIDNSMTRTQGGTGLGLAICKHLVQLHGGKVWVESEPGKGSTFSFSIPVVQGG